MRLISDNPLPRALTPGDERFELHKRLRVLMDSLKDPDLHTPFSVMVSGSWGTGKTSAMRWMAHELRKPQEDFEIDTCWFYPWKYQDREDVWKGLIAEVILATIHQEGDETIDGRKVVSAVKRFGGFLGAGFVRVLSSLGGKAKLTTGKVELKKGESKVETPGAELELELSVQEAIKGFTEEYANHITPQKSHFNVFEEEVARWIRNNYSKKSRLVVFIDDLDRCMPDIALQVLEALKLYLNVEHIVFVVGVDREVIDQIVLKRYCEMFGTALDHKKTSQKASQYLDKMFQVEVDVQPSDHLVDRFRKDRLESHQWWNRISEDNRKYFDEVLRKQSGLTPRSVIRTINAALTRVEDPDDSESLTASIWQALIELVLRTTSGLSIHQQEAWRRADGREFFILWRKNICQRRASGDLRTYLTLNVPSNSSGRSVSKHVDSSATSSLEQRLREFGMPELAEDKFSSYWNLTTVPLLGTLAAITIIADGTPSWTSTEDVASELRGFVAAHKGCPVADITDHYLAAVTTLNLSGTQMTDKSLEDISKFLTLDFLSLARTQITDDGLERISMLKALRWLSLSDTQVTDKGLDSLVSLRALTYLYLSNTNTSDKGLILISTLLNLNALNLSGTNITDAGLMRLSTLDDLKTLSLSRTQVTDIGVEHLSVLSNLEWLDVTHTYLTDESLKVFSRFKKLSRLDLIGTQITEEGREWLRKELPSLRIWFTQ